MRITELAPAFVLHRRRYGDTSLLLELFAREQGRIAAVARGAAQARSRRSGLLQGFMPLLVTWSGRGEVATLGKAEAAGAPVRLQGTALFCGLYMNELLIRLLPRNDSTVERARAALALAPSMTHEADGRTPIRADRRYVFRAQSGAEPAGGDDPDGVSGQTLLDLAAGEFDDARTRTEARDLMRGLIAQHLDGRPLKSRELFLILTRKRQ